MSTPNVHDPRDRTDAEWALLAPLSPEAKPGGRPRKWPLHAILNGSFSLVRGGCAWRMLPRCFSPWSTVHHACRQWRMAGTWVRIHTVLRERERVRQGRAPQPTAAAIDSRSVKTTSVGGVRGDDGAKQLRGRKRHLVVDTAGLVRTATVHAAAGQDRAAVSPVLAGAPIAFPHLTKLRADQGYTGAGKAWIEAARGWTVAIVRHAPRARGEWRPIGDPHDLRTLRFAWVRLPKAPKQFRGILPRRWVVERTVSWLGQSRRLRQHQSGWSGMW